MWKARSKGQASLEVLLITVFIITMAFLLTSAWFNLNDETKAVVLFKTAAVEKLSKADNFYVLRKVEVVNTTADQLDLDAYITPRDFSANNPGLALEVRLLGDDVAGKTKYSTVNVVIR
jgi:hypothetical protein